MPVAVAELTATARLHIVIRLSAPLSVADLGLVAPAVVSLRFAGGAIFNPVATVASDLDEILDDWGSQVWLVANRQQDIENAADRLDAALDRLQTNNPRYGLASIGFQGIEPPRPRNGLRDSSYRHIYAGGIVGLMEWVPAAGSGDDCIFWSASWDRATFACLGWQQI